ncbi:hypothetical protein GQ53DRAFT_287516 [Thozetella sp. PMI_491]|nr:hypothetical protein GQ53DRAFT_287516 [Thozetella sp. PMI_491]
MAPFRPTPHRMTLRKVVRSPLPLHQLPERLARSCCSPQEKARELVAETPRREFSPASGGLPPPLEERCRLPPTHVFPDVACIQWWPGQVPVTHWVGPTSQVCEITLAHLRSAVLVGGLGPSGSVINPEEGLGWRRVAAKRLHERRPTVFRSAPRKPGEFSAKSEARVPRGSVVWHPPC